MSQFTANNSLLSMQLQAFGISAFLIGFQEIRSLVGKEKLRNFLLGKYQKPSTEQRIFMFLDLKNSTRLTETLGNEKYFSFLNNYFNDLTAPILKSEAEIYQYVGDEIVLSWKMKKGLRNSNCLRFFEWALHKMKEQERQYLDRFGVVPTFKAGLHTGEVLIAQIGEIKKEIVFSGDVLNATSRMEGLCNQNKAQIIVSDVLLKQLQPSKYWEISPLPETSLRGKDEKIELYKLNYSSSDRASSS